MDDPAGQWRAVEEFDNATAPPTGICARAIVDRVIDGDTVCIDVCYPLTIRLKECWAPEVRGDDKAAGERSKREMERLLPPGSRCKVFIPTQNARKLGDVFTFGRVVGWLYRKVVGEQTENVSRIMVDNGFATREKK